MIELEQAARTVKKGGVIAYPTEAVFGLGCDPFNQQAVERLLNIKHRHEHQGLILIAATWSVFEPLIASIEPAILANAHATWPGPFTWIFPANTRVPAWLCGPNHTIALRVTAHPIARTLCSTLNAPLVSTSANLAKHPPLRDAESVARIFGHKLDFVLPGAVDRFAQPTEIRDVLTGKVLRESK